MDMDNLQILIIIIVTLVIIFYIFNFLLPYRQEIKIKEYLEYDCNKTSRLQYLTTAEENFIHSVQTEKINFIFQVLSDVSLIEKWDKEFVIIRNPKKELVVNINLSSGDHEIICFITEENFCFSYNAKVVSYESLHYDSLSKMFKYFLFTAAGSIEQEDLEYTHGYIELTPPSKKAA